MDRAEIRKVAVDRFCVQGFHATTLRQLAGDLGVTPGSLYHHYRTKEELLQDVIEAIVQHNIEGLRAAIASSSDRLRDAIYYHVYSHCLERPEAFVVQYDYRALPDRYRATADRMREEYEAEFKFLLRAQIASGTMPDQNLFLAMKGILSIGIYASHWFKPDGQLSASEVASWYADASMSMLQRRVAEKPASPGAVGLISEVID